MNYRALLAAGLLLLVLPAHASEPAKGFWERGSLQSPTSSEATRGGVLYEVWFDQSFAERRVSLRLGKLRADAEFLTSTYGEDPELGGAATLFANASFGFPGVYGLALPGGGPAYPLSNGVARRHGGNWGVADQLLVQTGEGRAQGIGVSARLVAAPGDRNAADLQANLAVTWKGALPAGAAQRRHFLSEAVTSATLRGPQISMK